MIFRQAGIADIPRIQYIRNSVKENMLSDPSLVSDADCERFIMKLGKGWVCEIEKEIIGFSIIDVSEKNIWALFVHPDHEGKGVGRGLHDRMLNWYFQKFEERLWLGTSPKTRAEDFYRHTGWTEAGLHGKGEIKFIITKKTWMDSQTK